MWPPQSVNTWPTPAPLSVRATSSPPVIQSEGAAPSEPPPLSSRQPPRFTDSPRLRLRLALRPRDGPAARTTRSTDSPRGARRRASAAAARLARPDPPTRPSPATACGPHCRSPEFLPFDGLAVEALGDEDVADAMDHRLAPADVGDEPGDVGDQTRDRLGEAARSVPRGARSARHRRMVREAGVPPRQRAERRVVCEPARVARPVGERRAAPEARRL